MPEPRLEGLRLELLRGGIAPYYVNRTLLELREHYADLVADALETGRSAEEADAEARAALGSEQALAGAVLARRELKTWSARSTSAAGVRRLLDALATVHRAPVALCAERGTEIARWSVSAGLSIVLTAAWLLTLHWLIVSGP